MLFSWDEEKDSTQKPNASEQKGNQGEQQEQVVSPELPAIPGMSALAAMGLQFPSEEEIGAKVDTFFGRLGEVFEESSYRGYKRAYEEAKVKKEVKETSDEATEPAEPKEESSTLVVDGE